MIWKLYCDGEFVDDFDDYIELIDYLCDCDHMFNVIEIHFVEDL